MKSKHEVYETNTFERIGHHTPKGTNTNEVLPNVKKKQMSRKERQSIEEVERKITSTNNNRSQ